MSAASGRAPFERYRALLAAAGFRPSRRRGQNFLLDPTLHVRIVEAAGVGPGDLVVEVGAGLGFLTRELVRGASRVVAVEIDARLFALLERERLAWEGGARVRLVHLDALERGRWNPSLLALVDEERRAAGGGRWLLVANLPYSATGPLLAGMAQLACPPEAGAVMVQEEVARRMTAAAGTHEYGALSVLLQASYRLELARRVGPDVFWPRPAVGSAVVTFARRASPALLDREATEREAFARFVRALFGQRRKQLQNALPGARRAVGQEPVAPALPAEWSRERPDAVAWERIVKIWDLARGSP